MLKCLREKQLHMYLVKVVSKSCNTRFRGKIPLSSVDDEKQN